MADEARVKLTCLGVRDQEERTPGFVAFLEMEVLAGGRGVVYADPVVHALTSLDPLFSGAIHNAHAAICHPPRGIDVRWRMEPERPEDRLPELAGPSAGAAFVLGLEMLRKMCQGEAVFPESGIAITAAVDTEGNLQPVGGIVDKLIAARRRALVPITHVIVATGQDCPTDTDGLVVVPVGTVPEAFEECHKVSRVRRAVVEDAQKACRDLEVIGRGSRPIKDLYQVLPLLWEVPPEYLPRERRREPEEHEGLPDGEDRYARLRSEDIRVWEEAAQRREVTYERHTVAEVFSQFRRVARKATSDVPRLVVLGPPGSGKSCFLDYLGWLCTLDGADAGSLSADEASLRSVLSRVVPARVRLREWEAWASLPEHREAGLLGYLTEHYQGRLRKQAPTEEQ